MNDNRAYLQQINSLKVEIEQLKQTLRAWAAKTECPSTAIQGLHCGTGKWVDDSLLLIYWGVDVARRIKPEEK